MSKERGGSRVLKPHSVAYRRTQDEVVALRESGRYSSVEFSFDGGGYVAIEKSTRKHLPEEVVVAHILADYGYRVVLKDEVTTIQHEKTPDGFLFTLSFEQRTPEGITADNCRRALEHARMKRADIALIYDKYHKYHRSTVDNGLKIFEEHNTYRFKQIIVIADDGRIHRHKHNDT